MSWKLATFNANGIRARLGIIRDWLEAEQPDVLCIQETKVQDKDFPLAPLEELGYRASFWGQKSYNGVATLTRRPPGQVLRGFAGDGLPPEEQARLITVEVDGVWVVNTYVPQGREVADPAFQYKLDFLERLRAWLAKRFMGAPGVGKGRVQVIGGVSLGPRERAVIVEVEGQRLLLGVAQGNVRLLRELPGGPQSAFSETLAQTAGGEGAA